MSSFFSTSYFSDVLTSLFERRSGEDAPVTDAAFADLIADLNAAQSEAQQNRISGTILLKYHGADTQTRLDFFRLLANEFDVDPTAISDAAAAYAAAPSAQTYAALSKASDPERIKLFRKLANVRGGAKCLVKIREHVRTALKSDASLAPLDLDLKRMLVAWFNRGFLVLRPITWQTPANILEKIIAYEAVHQIHDWDDLRRRLHPHDRRCYAFFHPRMPDDPIIFVEVALTTSVPGSIDAVLAEDRDTPHLEDVKTATFYSISNCHAGLAGISFGNALIKQVARDLSAELPQLETFVTLSPIPTMAKHVTQQPEDAEHLKRAAASFLAETKRGDGTPADPVARFHLGNGAIIHDVHAGANLSSEGQSQSYGAMVNYLNDLSKVEDRVEQFAETKVAPVSPQIQSLLKPPRRNRRKDLGTAA